MLPGRAVMASAFLLAVFAGSRSDEAILPGTKTTPMPHSRTSSGGGLNLVAAVLRRFAEDRRLATDAASNLVDLSAALQAGEDDGDHHFNYFGFNIYLSLGTGGGYRTKHSAVLHLLFVFIHLQLRNCPSVNHL